MFFWFVFLGFFVLFVIGGRLFSGAGIIVLAFLSLLVACDEGHGGKGVDSTVPLLLFCAHFSSKLKCSNAGSYERWGVNTMARFALVFHSNQSLSQEFTRMQKILWITVIKATIFTRIHINNNSCDFLNAMRIVPNTCDFFLLLYSFGFTCEYL